MFTLKLKLPPLVVTILATLLMWLTSRFLPDFLRWSFPPCWIAGLVFSAGLYFSLHGVWEFRRNRTTMDPRVPDQTTSLVCSGIYSLSRNPMYLGFLMFILAAFAMLRFLPLIVFAPLFILYMNVFQIKPEEEVMEEKFGEVYRQYRNRVRRWL